MRLLLALCCLSSTASAADLWDWSKPAEHHNTAVVCRFNDSATTRNVGSGVYIEHNGVYGILTAAHTFEGAGQNQVEILFQDGYCAKRLKWMSCKYQNDVAFVWIKHPSIKPLKLSKGVQNRLTESMTFGGPYDPKTNTYRLRTHLVTPERIGSGKLSKYQMNLIHGDSGSALLQDKKVVGITIRSEDDAYRTLVDRDNKRWHVYPAAEAVSLSVLTAFMNRMSAFTNDQSHKVDRRVCTPFGCYTLKSYNMFQPFRVPQNPAPVRVVNAPPVNRPTQFSDSVLDGLNSMERRLVSQDARYQRLELKYDELAAAHEAVLRRLDGVKSGKDGVNGKDGRDGSDALVDYEKIQKNLPRIRFILTEGKKVLDDETYGLGEPIILDIERIRGKK